MPYDRDEVLARTDLGALADEVLGPRRGRGRSATWPCPDPGHGSQTGRTPPVSLFRSPAGDERWHCHACGAGGTAADLVMATQGVGFGEAIAVLAKRAGLGRPDDRQPALRAKPVERAAPPPPDPSAEIEAHVARCEAYLWSPAGRPMRRWLAGRGLDEAILRANRVGADPGPSVLWRPAGLPRSGPAVILPVLDADTVAVYLQARYLQPPGGRKYDNPVAAVAGPSPRLAEVRLAGPPGDPSTVLVCEGLPDALIAAQARYRATAVLGAGLPDERVARSLTQRFATERLVVAFDADERGRSGSARLVELLEAAGAGQRVAVADVPAPWGDLNGWHVATGPAFGRELATAVGRAGPATTQSSPAIPEGLLEQLEAIHSRHVLIDDPVLASRNLARLRRVVTGWERNGIAVDNARRTAPRSALEQDLETLAHRHLLVDPAHVGDTLAAVKAAVAGWSSGHEPHGSRLEPGRGPIPPRPRMAVVAPAPDRGLGIDL